MEIDLNALKESLKYPELDWAFGEMVARRSGRPDDSALKLLSATALRAVEESHSCLDLEPWLENFPEKPFPALGQWIQLIENEWVEAIATAGVRDHGFEPMVWLPDCHALYLRQYHQAEREIREYVRNSPRNCAGAPGEEEIRSLSKRFASTEAADQVKAVAKVFQRQLSIITGGPGTGKTTTLAAMLALELTKNPGLQIALCAPTGKAAAQMHDSILIEAEESLNVPAPVKAKLADLPHQTIHKLLGISRFNDGKPRFNSDFPLPFELVIVDECSMVDLRLFRMLLNALDRKCRLLLLGDKDQLDAVEAGKVFSELCNHAEELRLPCARLEKNFRSRENPKLVAFARELVAGDRAPEKGRARELAGELFGLAAQPAAERHFWAEEWTGREKAEVVRGRFQGLAAEWLNGLPKWQSAAEALEHLNDFKVLCAVHDGPCGTRNLNRVLVEIFLGGRDLGSFPPGLPLMVTRNDDVTGLKNGDVGVCWGGEVHFDGSRKFKPAQLPEHEIAFATTVHKAQGGSYQNVVFVLPEQENELLTVNLVYTAITRARKNCLVLGRPEILAKALQTATRRWGHLFGNSQQANCQ